MPRTTEAYKKYQREYRAKRRKIDSEFAEIERQKSREWKNLNRKKVHEYDHTKYWTMRFKVLEILGNKCNKCPVNDFRVLQIDHINGGGYKEIKRLKSEGILRKILKHPDPQSEYQLLCANCNWVKRWENKEYGHRLHRHKFND